MATAEKLNYLLETKNQIKNAINGKGVSVLDTDSFRSYVSKIQQIQVGNGGNSEDTFLKARTNNGTNGRGLFAYIPTEICNNSDFKELIQNIDTSNMTDFSYMFHSSEFSELNFSNWNMNRAINIQYMFYTSKFTKIDFSNCNIQNINNMMYMCYGASNLTELNLTNCDTSNVTNMNLAFYNCKSLVKILGILNMNQLSSFTNVFGANANNSPKLLQQVQIKNLNASGLNLSACENLSHDSLMYLINNLVESATAKTVSLGTVNLAKLTDEEKAIATNKNWTLA